MTTPAVPKKWIRNRSDELAAARGYTFDERAGARVITFLETFCRQSKGEWAKKPLKVIDWQRDIVMRLYGWKTPDGLRRFKRAYIEIPKKNGKSTLLSGIALYEGMAAGEPGAEVYIIAYDRSQASIIFDESANMVRSSPALAKHLTPIRSRKTITHDPSASKIQALSSDVPSKDGINPSFAIFDELHRQRTSAMWDIFKYGGAARRQPLTLSITTAGVDRHSVCYQEHEHAERVNSGVTEDLRFFGVIYGATIEDDFRDPAVWRRANPSMGVTLREEDFDAELADCEGKPAALNNWLRLRLNVWTQAVTSYIPPETWKGLAERFPDDLEWFGRDAVAGLDLSSTQDVTAFVALVDLDDGRKAVITRLWVPEETAEQRSRIDHVPYLQWVKEGWLRTTPGSRIDYAFIKAEILDLAAKLNLTCLYADSWNATQLCGELIEEGLRVEFLRQGDKSLNEPTKTLETWCANGSITHDGNPAMAWMIGNACVETGAAGNVKLSKAKSSEKIDGPAALVNAVAARIAEGTEGDTSVYEGRGILTL